MRPDARTAAARAARTEMTLAERLLWARLRRRAVRGWKFRRQADCGPYLVDFLCHAPPLAVEVDGPAHRLWRTTTDGRRDVWLVGHGFVVLRIPERDVRCDIDGVIARIEAAGSQISPPSLAGEGPGVGGVLGVGAGPSQEEGAIFGAPQSAFTTGERRRLARMQDRLRMKMTALAVSYPLPTKNLPPTKTSPPTPFPSPASEGGEA